MAGAAASRARADPGGPRASGWLGGRSERRAGGGPAWVRRGWAAHRSGRRRSTRPRPRARCTSFAAGPTRRTRRDARPSRARSGRRAPRGGPSAVDGSPALTIVEAIPTSRSRVGIGDGHARRSPWRFASSAARALPSPTRSRAFQVSIQSIERGQRSSSAATSPRPTRAAEPIERMRDARPARPARGRPRSPRRRAARRESASRRKTPIRSPGGRPDLLADDDGQPRRLGRATTSGPRERHRSGRGR